MEDEFIKDVKKIKLLLISVGILVAVETAISLVFVYALSV